MFISCAMANEKVGTMAYMDNATITEIENGVYGVKGVIYPKDKAFYSKKNVKYKLLDRDAKLLLKNKSVGDKLPKFLFEFDTVNKSDDWSTVIHIVSF